MAYVVTALMHPQLHRVPRCSPLAQKPSTRSAPVAKQSHQIRMTRTPTRRQKRRAGASASTEMSMYLSWHWDYCYVCCELV